jgi:hypothetical protein
MHKNSLERKQAIVNDYITTVMSQAEIARKYSISKQYINEVLKEYNIKNIDKIDMKIKQCNIKQLRIEGKTFIQIAKIIGISEIALIKRINKKDYPRYGEGKWYCKKCKIIDDINNFRVNNNGYEHKICHNKYRLKYNKENYNKPYRKNGKTIYIKKDVIFYDI